MLFGVVLWFFTSIPYVLSVTKINNRVLSLVTFFIYLVFPHSQPWCAQVDWKMLLVYERESDLGCCEWRGYWGNAWWQPRWRQQLKLHGRQFCWHLLSGSLPRLQKQQLGLLAHPNEKEPQHIQSIGVTNNNRIKIYQNGKFIKSIKKQNHPTIFTRLPPPHRLLPLQPLIHLQQCQLHPDVCWEPQKSRTENLHPDQCQALAHWVYYERKLSTQLKFVVD